MEKLPELRAKYREIREEFRVSSGPTVDYAHGKVVGFIEGAAIQLGVSWTTAYVLLQKGT